MAQNSVEQRLEALEEQMQRVTRRLSKDADADQSWKRLVGIYRDDLAFDEAERIGREWRESFRPKGDEVAPL